LHYDRIKALLFDLDGVLYIGDEIIDGAPEAVSFTRECELPLAGLTNTTTQCKRMVAEKLAHFDIPIFNQKSIHLLLWLCR